MKDALRLATSIDLGDGTPPIVMVDDEELDHELVRRFHKRSGLANPLLPFADGEAFLAFLERVKNDTAPLPALVLMDINMPRMTGFETVETMRRDPFYRSVPVVMMMTSSSDQRDREQARTVGADGVLVKPFNPRGYLELFAALAAS